MMLRGCENDQERQQIQDVVMVEPEDQAANLQDDDLPDWMKQVGAVPAWFGSGDNAEQSKAFMGMIPKQST